VAEARLEVADPVPPGVAIALEPSALPVVG